MSLMEIRGTLMGKMSKSKRLITSGKGSVILFQVQMVFLWGYHQLGRIFKFYF